MNIYEKILNNTQRLLDIAVMIVLPLVVLGTIFSTSIMPAGDKYVAPDVIHNHSETPLYNSLLLEEDTPDKMNKNDPEKKRIESFFGDAASFFVDIQNSVVNGSTQTAAPQVTTRQAAPAANRANPNAQNRQPRNNNNTQATAPSPAAWNTNDAEETFGTLTMIFGSLKQVDPSAPTDPSAATDPSASVDPSAATDPSASVDPSAPTDPSASVDPSAPTDPSASVDPSAPTDPSASVDPSAPTDPSASVDPSAPTDPSASVDPSAPTDPSASVDPSAPTDPSACVDPSVPTNPSDAAATTAGTAPKASKRTGKSAAKNSVQSDNNTGEIPPPSANDATSATYAIGDVRAQQNAPGVGSNAANMAESGSPVAHGNYSVTGMILIVMITSGLLVLHLIRKKEKGYKRKH